MKERSFTAWFAPKPFRKKKTPVSVAGGGDCGWFHSSKKSVRRGAQSAGVNAPGYSSGVALPFPCRK